jgi:hypothetical protein
VNLRPLHIIFALASLAFFSCQKELSYEGTPIPHQGDFRAVVDGTPWVASDSTKGAIILGNVINISGISADNRQLSITLQDTVTGVYILNQTSLSIAAYADIDSADIYAFATNQGSDTSQAGGQVTITEIDKVNKTLSGTFAFKAFRNIDGHQKQITAGVFYKLPYTSSLPPAVNTDTLTVTIDTAWKAQSIVSSSISGQVVITGSALSGTPSVSLIFPAYITPGSYALTPNPANPAVIYLGLYNPGSSVNLISQSGTLTILENNSTTRRIRGNFQFLAGDPANTLQTAQLTSGYFSVQVNP